MKLKTLLTAMALGAGALAVVPASAATIKTPDGALSPWGGFDWAQAGTAFTTGFTGIAGNQFDMTIFAAAVSLDALGGGPFLGLKLDSSMNGASQGAGWYEYTLVAKVTEQISSCTATDCKFDILSGTFDIYLDTTPDADMRAGKNGTGFLDGVRMISGVFGAQDGGTFTTSGNGSNSTTVTGNVTYTNLAYINPALVTTTATTTLQLGTAQTNWTNPGGFNGTPWAPGSGEIVMQADANQSFTSAQVPEPTTLALLGVALAGMGVASRRKGRAQS